jgi:uncharacterized membrane protein
MWAPYMCKSGGRGVWVNESWWQVSLRERVSKIAEELCEDKYKIQKQAQILKSTPCSPFYIVHVLGP